MEWDNALSGLVGAALGLVGAVAIQWFDMRRAQSAAARATFMEVAANSAALDEMKKFGVYVPVASSAWAQEQVRLAHALSPGDFVTVATYYMRVDLLREAGFPTSGGPNRELVAAAGNAFDRGELAASLLDMRGWFWPWQRKALHEQLAKGGTTPQ